MKIVFTSIGLLLLIFSAKAQKEIKVHFLYGSVPAKNHKHIEEKRFGGIKGGHVTIQLGDSIVGFHPGGRCHIIGNKKPAANGHFTLEQLASWSADSVSNKYTSITIPVTEHDYLKIAKTVNQYLHTAPYDYAVFGMRCAAATYDILEDIGIVPSKTTTGKWVTNFYPQVLRRKLLSIAEQRNYPINRQQGKPTRKWERE